MIWALANLRLIAVGLAIVSIFAAGWHSHSVYDRANANKALTEAVERANKAESALIKFNSDLEEATDVKDVCFRTPIPAGVIKLLH